MRQVIDETNRRRALQIEYNRLHNINPKTVYKSLEEILNSTSVADIQVQRMKRMEDAEQEKARRVAEPLAKYMTEEQRNNLLEQMHDEMKRAAKDLDFERAAELRDEIQRLKLAEEIQKEKKKPE
jgi:excinuclease ABC subunit B